MGGAPNQKVDVKLSLVGPNWSSGWNMDIAGQGKGGPNGYPPAKVAHGSAADFQFVITGPGTQNITFAAVNPISVSPDNGTGNSPTAIGINTDQIINVGNGGGRVLTFTDKNQSTQLLTYQLNFNVDKPLDPIINNGGGGPPGFHYEYLIAGGLLLALLAAFFLRNRFRKAPVVRDENG